MFTVEDAVNREIERITQTRAKLKDILPQLEGVQPEQSGPLFREVNVVGDLQAQMDHALSRLASAVERAPHRVLNMDGYDPSCTVSEWMLEHSDRNWITYTVRLSAWETGADGRDDGGPRIPYSVMASAFPSVTSTPGQPQLRLTLAIDSHGFAKEGVRVTRAGIHRDLGVEHMRLVGFGGAASPLLYGEHTGAIAVFAFRLLAGGDSPECRVWICRDAGEEDDFEAAWGVVEPGVAIVGTADHGRVQLRPSRGLRW